MLANVAPKRILVFIEVKMRKAPTSENAIKSLAAE
jgi:Holliday junction resolvase-like predicted endonuclease